jgi:hypothetical protein
VPPTQFQAPSSEQGEPGAKPLPEAPLPALLSEPVSGAAVGVATSSDEEAVVVTVVRVVGAATGAVVGVAGSSSSVMKMPLGIVSPSSKRKWVGRGEGL